MINEKTTRVSNKTNDYVAIRKEYECPRVAVMRFDVLANTMEEALSAGAYDAGTAILNDDVWGNDE